MPKQKSDIPTYEEAHKFIDSFRAPEVVINSMKLIPSKKQFYKTFYLLLLKTGRRLSEIHNLKVEDIDESNQVIWIHVLKKRKKIREQTPLDNSTLGELYTFLDYNPPKKGYIFHAIPLSTIKRNTPIFAENLGIKKNISAHSFRHYFVTRLGEMGYIFEQITTLLNLSESRSVLWVYHHPHKMKLFERLREDLKNI